MIAEWRERLQERLGADGRGAVRVHGALTTSAARKAGRSDAVFVSLSSERSGASSTLALVRQERTVTVSVLLRVSCGRDELGVLEELDQLRERVDAALLGWSPDSAAGQATHVSGRVAAVEDGVTWFEDLYAVPRVVGAGDC